MRQCVVLTATSMVLVSVASGCASSSWPFGKKEPTAAEAFHSPGVGQKPPSSSSSSFLGGFWPGSDAAAGGPPKTYLDANDPLNPTGEATVPGKIYVQQAEIAEAKGDNPAAIASYRRALTAEPRNTAAHLGLARLYDRSGDHTGAIQAYKSAIESAPENPSCHNDFGTYLARHQDHATAAKAFGRAVELAPTSVLYRNNLAVVLVTLTQYDDALRELAAVHPPAVAHYNLAFLLKERGETTAARRHLTEAIKLDPQLTPARTLLASLERPASGPSMAQGGGANGDMPAARVSLRSDAGPGPANSSESGLVGQTGGASGPTPTPWRSGSAPIQKETSSSGPLPWANPGTGPTATPSAPSGPSASPPAGQPDSLPPWMRAAIEGTSASVSSPASSPTPTDSSAHSTTAPVSYTEDPTRLAPVVPLR